MSQSPSTEQTKPTAEQPPVVVKKYANRRLYDAMLEELDASLRLCLAVDLTGPEEFAQTRTVQQWRQGVPPPTLDRRPAVFLLGS